MKNDQHLDAPLNGPIDILKTPLFFPYLGKIFTSQKNG